LSEVFRYAVRHSEREWVRLEEELLVVNAYLDIERARFGNRLHVETEIDDAARELQIPAMVIQTLAENAIKHGIAAIRGPGRIAIVVRCEGDCVFVRVQDSGPGFPPDVTPDRLPDPTRSGYGLRNVRERLSTYFGSEARMMFRRGEGNTQVELRIPFRKEETTYACAHRG
jgi:LytS/YehU family sensor histidine kinase